jgi:site-specific DNA-methyltransferase (adenine-specific)
MDEKFNRIVQGDCIARMNKLSPHGIDLAFADPPFNIGYDYDVYDDQLEHQQYIDWSRKWITAVDRVLKPDGAFWLAIGDEYAAELKLVSQEIGLFCRSWVVWYYTFGVNCARKFTRSHAHLFHFVKDKENFTFREDDLYNRVPSARELVYNDRRANPRGRLPDDTWIIRPANLVGELVCDDHGSWDPELVDPPADRDRTFTLRPQDLDQCFSPAEDTWYFPRVAGTFKERAGFHGCQMPEQLLGRIIRTCSRPGEIVLDPFSGSATTLAVAKKLGRRFLGFEVSQDYVQYGRKRVSAVRVGDRLDGSPEPTKSAPKTGQRPRNKPPGGAQQLTPQELWAQEKHYQEAQLEMTLLGVVEAFRQTHDGFSADRVVADPQLNQAFVGACQRIGLVGDARTWNMLLFRLRKAGRLAEIETERRTSYSWEDCDPYLFASEIAWQSHLNDQSAQSLDEILCSPQLATQFDAIAKRLAPGYQSLDYRWAALKLRKQAKYARTRAAVLTPPARLGQSRPLAEVDANQLPSSPGLYVMSEDRNRKLYVGETLDLRRRLKFNAKQRKAWEEFADSIRVQILPLDDHAAGILAWQSCLVKKLKPRLNCFELGSAS